LKRLAEVQMRPAIPARARVGGRANRVTIYAAMTQVG
jgi:hypothetical protein